MRAAADSGHGSPEASDWRGTSGAPRHPRVRERRGTWTRSAQGRARASRVRCRRHRVKAALVHALNEEARRFYMRFDFEPSPAHPLHLMLLMKDIRASGWRH